MSYPLLSNEFETQGITTETHHPLLHLVFGGRLCSLEEVQFADLSKLDIVGIFPNYKTAFDAWRAKAQQSVDDAQQRYFIVHIHRQMQPTL